MCAPAFTHTHTSTSPPLSAQETDPSLVILVNGCSVKGQVSEVVAGGESDLSITFSEAAWKHTIVASSESDRCARHASGSVCITCLVVSGDVWGLYNGLGCSLLLCW